ncbi:MAG TPA: hypothetical protein PLL06_10600, partial [Acidobacteriota bacterium]|nr:hypothetical protein [Acidobacteriota bacterium]
MEIFSATFFDCLTHTRATGQENQNTFERNPRGDNMKKQFSHFAFALVLVIAASAVAMAQNFQKSYPLSAGGSISVKNVSGDIKINGYGGETVQV